jgi:hypothetical protein
MKTFIVVFLLFLSIFSLSLKGNELNIHELNVIDSIDLPTANSIDVRKQEEITKEILKQKQKI